ncbi:MAG: tRNA lysidine(34) synthetase TilS [Tumebacillaceae bacterium]
MLGKLRDTIEKYDLFRPCDTVLVAVSGGIDSVALLHALKELGIGVAAAHVDHGLRGEESRGDALFVRELADKWQIPFYSKEFDVHAYAEAHKLSTQVAARELRYGYLTEVAQAICAQKIATAHHADDQAETVLMRIVRGTSIRGVTGIPLRREERGIEVVRPLLEVWRSEIEEYANERDIPHREDSSNASIKYLRNKIRLQLLPILQSEYNAGVKAALLQIAEHAREDEEVLGRLAEDAFSTHVQRENPHRMRMDRNRLAMMPLSLQRRLITLILYYLRGNNVQWEQVHINSIRSLAASPSPSGEVRLPDGLLAWCEYDDLLIGDDSRPDEAPQPFVLAHPGTYALDAYGIRLEMELVEGIPRRPKDSWEAHFDADELSGSCIYIRIWARGDSLRPHGFSGTKLISDVLGEAKIPKHRRRTWPLLCIDDAIAWVVGVRRGEQAPVTQATQRTLVLRASQLT